MTRDDVIKLWDECCAEDGQPGFSWRVYLSGFVVEVTLRNPQNYSGSSLRASLLEHPHDTVRISYDAIQMIQVIW